MDVATRAELRELLAELDAAADGGSNDREIAAGYELAERVRALVDAEPKSAAVADSGTLSATAAAHVDALREVVDMAERNDVTTPEQDAALRWAVTVAESPTLTRSAVMGLHVVLGAAQHEYRVRWLGDDGHPMEGTARHLVVSPDDFRFPDERTDVRDAYLRITTDGGPDVTRLVWDLIGDVASGAFVVVL